MSYADEAAAVSGKASAGTYGLCCANGCPLAGSLTTSTNGSDKWFCRVHFGTPYSEHDGITARINNRLDLYRIADDLSNYTQGAAADQKIRAQIKALGRRELLQPTSPGRPFTAQGLAGFIFSVLDKECRMPQAHMGVPEQAGATSWVDEPETAS
jgi:hypothetical protein